MPFRRHLRRFDFALEQDPPLFTTMQGGVFCPVIPISKFIGANVYAP